jgi:hypothetical protein
MGGIHEEGRVLEVEFRESTTPTDFGLEHAIAPDRSGVEAKHPG